jgi:hypothetical protein
VTPSLDTVFLVLWAILAFVVLRAAGARYFHETGRASVAAGAAAAAFLIGGWTPFAMQIRGGAAEGARAKSKQPSAFTLAVGADPATHLQDLAACKAGLHVAAGGVGALDVVEVVVGREPIEHGSIPTVEGGQSLRAIGWGANVDAKAPAPSVCPEIDGKIVAGGDVLYGTPRPDVAAALKDARLFASGYTITVPPSALPRGRHRFGVAVVANRHAFLIGERPVVVL